jgi:hypothetical protein
MAFALVAVMLSAVAAAQAYAPIVTMVVTMPDGRTQELTAAESGLATLTLKDGTEYEFRPTIQDGAPWNRGPSQRVRQPRTRRRTWKNIASYTTSEDENCVETV